MIIILSILLNDHIKKFKFITKSINEHIMADSSHKQYSNLVTSINKTSYLLNKHDSIRLKHWLDKLATPVTNSIWKQNRNLYLKILLEMTTQGELQKPFNQSPPEGPLPRLTLYDIPYPIRSKLTEEDIRDRHTPSQHKTSHHSRKTSFSSTLDPKRSVSKADCKLQENIKKRIQFDLAEQTSKGGKHLWNSETDSKQNIWVNGVTRSTSISKKLSNGMKDIMQRDLSNDSKNSTCKFNQNVSTSCCLSNKGIKILERCLIFLANHEQNLGHSIKYRQLLQKIVQTGDKLGENFRQVSISITSSENMEAKVEKYNERIKDKLFQTDLNTMEFMNYLHSIL